MNCKPLRNLAITMMLASTSGVMDAAADEILVYKVSAARRWQQNEAYLPLSATPQLRNANAGSFTDTSYLVLNRTSGEAVSVNYYTVIRDGGRYKEYTVEKDLFAVWAPGFPTDALWEYGAVAAPGNNAFTVSLKQGGSSDFSGDFNGDGQADTTKEGYVSFLVGAAATRTFGRGVSAVTVPQVPARLTGVKREGKQISYGPLQSPQAFGETYYRGAGGQTATLDAKLTESALALASPANLVEVTSASSTDRLTKAAHGLETADAVTFVSGTNFPELTDGTTYYVIRVSSSQFQLSQTLRGAKTGVAVDLTANGTLGEISPFATRGAVALVQAALDRLGYDNAAPPTPLLP